MSEQVEATVRHLRHGHLAHLTNRPYRPDRNGENWLQLERRRTNASLAASTIVITDDV